MIDLAPEQLAIVRRLLATYVPECEVRAFGSRVTWTAKPHSDLDLALFGPEKVATARPSKTPVYLSGLIYLMQTQFRRRFKGLLPAGTRLFRWLQKLIRADPNGKSCRSAN